MSDVDSLERDLRAIEVVNQRDVEFALANDAERMMSQWTDDIVLLQPETPIIRGRAAIADAFRSMERPRILGYALHIEEVTVAGGYAFEWGTYEYRMRPHSGGQTIQMTGKIMRILQRQPDGSWKTFRAMTS